MGKENSFYFQMRIASKNHSHGNKTSILSFLLPFLFSDIPSMRRPQVGTLWVSMNNNDIELNA